MAIIAMAIYKLVHMYNYTKETHYLNVVYKWTEGIR